MCRIAMANSEVHFKAGYMMHVAKTDEEKKAAMALFIDVGAGAMYTSGGEMKRGSGRSHPNYLMIY